MVSPERGRKPIRRGASQRMVDGKNFRLADEVRYILRRAAEHDGRVVTIGQLILFSTETGDAWLLDPSDQLAARLARDGDPHHERLEGALPHRGTRIRLHGPRTRAARHHSRISDAQANSDEMMLKIS